MEQKDIKPLDFGQYEPTKSFYDCTATNGELVLFYFVIKCPFKKDWRVESGDSNETLYLHGKFPSYDEAVKFANAHWEEMCTGGHDEQ